MSEKLLRTPLRDIGFKYPILRAGMGGAARKEKT